MKNRDNEAPKIKIIDEIKTHITSFKRSKTTSAREKFSITSRNQSASNIPTKTPLVQSLASNGMKPGKSNSSLSDVLQWSFKPTPAKGNESDLELKFFRQNTSKKGVMKESERRQNSMQQHSVVHQ